MKKKSGIVFALVAAVLFGLLIPLAKLSLQGLTPLQFAALLLLGAGIGMGCVVAVRALLGKSPQESAVQKSDSPKLASIAALNALAVALLAIGVYHTIAANASVLMGFEIAAATVFGWILLKRHVCHKACAAVGLICIASILLCVNATKPITFTPESLFILVACAIRGFEGTVKKSLADKDPVQIACVRSLGAGVVLAIIALVVDGLPAALFPFAYGALALGFATFGLGASFHLAAQRNLGSARSEAYFALAPFVGVIVSWSLFGLELEPLFFGSLALMALGVWLAMDDSVFHEDAYAALNQERMMLYTGEAAALQFDRMHRPL